MDIASWEFLDGAKKVSKPILDLLEEQAPRLYDLTFDDYTYKLLATSKNVIRDDGKERLFNVVQATRIKGDLNYRPEYYFSIGQITMPNGRKEFSGIYGHSTKSEVMHRAERHAPDVTTEVEQRYQDWSHTTIESKNLDGRGVNRRFC